jgi:acetyltransferase-like isoleucine patch superfamily enzyme
VPGDRRGVRSERARRHLEALFNLIGTHVPSHRVRQTWLRGVGAKIGSGCSIFRGTTVLGAERLVIGDHCAIGWRCVLDARGGLTIGDQVVLASDTQIITADHDPQSERFDVRMSPVRVGDRAWLATRVTVLKGVTVGHGGVAGAGSVVRDDIEPYSIVAGVPARPVARRPQKLDYHVDFRPLLH